MEYDGHSSEYRASWFGVSNLYRKPFIIVVRHSASLSPPHTSPTVEVPVIYMNL